MAEKNIKKAKRRINAKGRRVIRRVTAGLLMISALLVAAIPSNITDRAVAASESLDYSADSLLARNGDLYSATVSSNNFLDPSSVPSSKIFNSYEVRQIDGNWALLWKYKYYVPDGGVGGVTNVGVITGYNDTYEVHELKLSGDIITCYDFVSSADYNSYLIGTLNTINFRLDRSPYEGSIDGTTDLSEVKKYFPEKYEEWKNNYDSKLAEYQQGHDGANPSSLSDMGISPFNATGADMTDELKKIYFCDHTSRPGYTLESVKNLARKGTYRDTDGISRLIPDEDSIYVCKVYDSSANTQKTDDNQFQFKEGMSIIAIAEKAFSNTQKVDSMTVGQSVAYIGDSAFENSFIEKVEFASVTYIGNRVFKGCQYLNQVSLAKKTEIVGKEAFYGCKVLQNLVIPEGVKQIGYGAFSNCSILATVDFTPNHGVCIGEYAFYDCPLLNKVTFPESYDVSIGKAAFALTPGTGTAATLKEFNFPISIGEYASASNGETYTLDRKDGSSYHSRLGDYILANRNNLDTVVMPVNFGSSYEEIVPGNTFDMCINLGCLQFDKVSNGYVSYDDNLFEDVQNESLYVFGPATCNIRGTDGKYYAYPRRSTWESSSYVAEYVPYVYYADGKNHYEVGIGDYRYELEVNDDDNTATLLRCEFIKNESDIDLIVPNTVAKYSIKEMSSGCFDAIKPHILSITVEDGSVNTIGNSVFSGCDKLEWVVMGDSVQTLGANAFSNNSQLKSVTIGENIENIGNQTFADCPKLNDVFFEKPSSYSTLSSIGSSAFYTGSDKLIFHGDIVDGYLPFETAMGPDKINTNSVRIAYKSMDPSNLTCIMDEKTGYTTLIDYPHYCDLPVEIRNKYESSQSLNDDELALLNATMMLYIPEPIESIDVSSFLDGSSGNPNSKNFVYIPSVANDLATAFNRKEIYGNDSLNDAGLGLLSDYYADLGGYSAGLFSGYMNELTELTAAGVNSSGFATKGNDWILSVEMPGVKYIPNYAFDSCERMQSVIISEDCENIGEGAFRGCDSLLNIGTNNNPRYTFDNFILYEALDNGSYKIDTCLSSRGKSRNASEIWVNSKNDPLITEVSEIAPGAFSGCKNIAKVEMSDVTKLKAIPTKAFFGCTSLSSVELPDTIATIGKQAFDNGAGSLDITVPCDCNMSDEAFDKDTITTIWTYPTCTITAAYDPFGYDQLYIKFLNQAYLLTFLNDDLSIYDTISVYEGFNGFPPEKDPEPLVEQHKGYEFSHWLFDNENGFLNVRENRQAIAIFKAPSSASENTPSENKPEDDKKKDKDKDKKDDNNNSNSGSSSGNNGSTSDNKPSTTGYTVTVENGAGSGSYQSGQVVTVTAYSAASGTTFDKWTTSNSDIAFSSPSNVSTTFIMPAHDVKVTATYKTGSVSGNNAGASNNNSASNGNGEGNKKPGTGSTDVTITTDTIDNNKKNLGSATVAGSTDNFVIKITDSAYASAQVEEALKKKYNNDLSNIKYVAFDISLYDETGTYPIENYEELAVTITIPIPDDLVSYAGNNRAAAVINGEIDDKTVKFTTIDGVPCMTFTANHFSPYTVYVDSSNLLLGQADLTPKTGIDIAPKWFVVTALSMGGIILFIWREKPGKKSKKSLVK